MLLLLLIVGIGLFTYNYISRYKLLDKKVSHYYTQINKYNNLKECNKIDKELSYLWKHYSVNNNILEKDFPLIPKKYKKTYKLKKHPCINN